MLTIKNHKGVFKVRVAGVMRKENKILLLNEPLVGNYWFLPGGRAEMHETTHETLTRELEEEMRGKPVVGDLLWVTEHFFTLNQIAYHTLEFYYTFTLQGAHPLLTQDTYYAERPEDGVIKQFNFRWFAPDEIASADVRPPCLKKILLDPPHDSPAVRHLIARSRVLRTGTT